MSYTAGRFTLDDTSINHHDDHTWNRQTTGLMFSRNLRWSKRVLGVTGRQGLVRALIRHWGLFLLGYDLPRKANSWALLLAYDRTWAQKLVDTKIKQKIRVLLTINAFKMYLSSSLGSS